MPITPIWAANKPIVTHGDHACLGRLSYHRFASLVCLSRLFDKINYKAFDSRDHRLELTLCGNAFDSEPLLDATWAGPAIGSRFSHQISPS